MKTGWLWALLAAACLAPAGVSAQGPPLRDRLLVVPFENVNREARLYWLTEASAVLVSERLGAAGLDAISRDERLRAFERLQLPPVAALSEATVIRVGQLVGAGTIVTGGFTIEGADLVVRARTIRLDTGRMSDELIARGPLTDLYTLYDALGRRLSDAPGPDRATRVRPPLPAFENYIKGLLAETPASQVRFLDAALKLSPGYDEARIAKWRVYSAQGEHAKAAAATDAVPAASPLARRARFLSALSHLRLKQYDDAFQALDKLASEAPSGAVFNNLGIVVFRRGSTPQTGKPTYFFTKAAEAEADNPDYAFNVGYAYWFERDAKATIYWLKEALRRNPADGDAHYVVGVALQSTGAYAEAEREKELARQLSSTYSEWERRPIAATESVPRGLERVREEIDEPRLSLVDSTLAPGEKRDQEDLAVFHLDRARRLFDQARDREAIEELNRSLYVAPYQAEALLLLGRIHLKDGRLREASEALKISLWSKETVAGHLALAEVYLEARDLALATAEADKALALDPRSADARALKARIK